MPIVENRVHINLNNILFPTDFSPLSQKAGLYAAALARHYGATLTLAHVIDFAVTFGEPNAGMTLQVIADLLEANKGLLTEMETRFADKGIKVKTKIAEGLSPSDGLLKLAEQEAADMIVMGTNGRHGLGKMLLGSAAEAVIHRARCPVLTVGPQVQAPANDSLSLQTIVYATDFSPESAQAAVLALSFAQEFGSHIYLCHVLPRKKTTKLERRALADGFKLALGRMASERRLLDVGLKAAALHRMVSSEVADWCKAECVLEHGEAVSGILSLANEVNADLLVLGAKHAGEWLTQVKSGVAYQVIAQAGCPVLTVRN
jgi:nucleotide-binding universal stress UspA family protein